jgi:hypothetical protein
MKTLLPLLLVLAAPGFSQRPRHIVDLSSIGQAQKTASRARPMRPRIRGAEAKASMAPAPAVIQANLMDASNVVWLVTTDRLPAGTQISPFLVLPDGQELWMDTVALSAPVDAGSSFVLPNIRRFGDFWPGGLLTFGAVVTVGGRDTETLTDFPVASARIYDDLAVMVPRITTTSEGVTNGDLTLSIRGAFTADAPSVVFEDIVAPASAVRVSASEITVNLSQVPGLDLSSMWDALLTVGQAGWSDTAIFRHTPARPGSYRPAP